MKISVINGSPKAGKSTSGLLLSYLLTQIEGDHEVEQYHIKKTILSASQYDEITSSDVLVFAFPLYIDSIPAHVLEFLAELEKRTFQKQDAMVYCMINNGFFEGKQNHIAIEQMRNWCSAVNLTWGQGIGFGAGEMLPFLKDIPLGHGPNKNIGTAIKQASHAILCRETKPDLMVSPNWPRLLWKIQASLFVWYPRAKANGVKRKALYRQLKS